MFRINLSSVNSLSTLHFIFHESLNYCEPVGLTKWETDAHMFSLAQMSIRIQNVQFSTKSGI
jgi:hypothetical protein